MGTVRINLNEKVKVKLTDYGKEIYYHQFDGFERYITPHFPKEDANGFSTFQLWDFLHIFGNHIGMGMPNVIMPLEIFYEEENDNGKA